MMEKKIMMIDIIIYPFIHSFVIGECTKNPNYMLKSCKKSCYKVNPAFYPGVVAAATGTATIDDKSFYDIEGMSFLVDS
jgi:hypothetical protein